VAVAAAAAADTAAVETVAVAAADTKAAAAVAVAAVAMAAAAVAIADAGNPFAERSPFKHPSARLPQREPGVFLSELPLPFPVFVPGCLHFAQKPVSRKVVGL
jgi:hypothetical protein